MLFSNAKFFSFLIITTCISCNSWAAESAEETEPKTASYQCETYGSYQNDDGQWLTCENESTDNVNEVDEYQYNDETDLDYKSEEEAEQAIDQEY